MHRLRRGIQFRGWVQQAPHRHARGGSPLHDTDGDARGRDGPQCPYAMGRVGISRSFCPARYAVIDLTTRRGGNPPLRRLVNQRKKKTPRRRKPSRRWNGCWHSRSYIRTIAPTRCSFKTAASIRSRPGHERFSPCCGGLPRKQRVETNRTSVRPPDECAVAGLRAEPPGNRPGISLRAGRGTLSTRRLPPRGKGGNCRNRMGE